VTAPARRRLDDNLYVLDEIVYCRHCDTMVGSPASWLQHALVGERPAQDGDTVIQAAPELFIDAPVTYRQAFCPSCLTLLLTEVIAEADRHYRNKRLEAIPE
jgi:N-methylhydantoinase B